MFGGHGHDYFYDSLAFALSLIRFAVVAALVVASLLDQPLKLHPTIRERKVRK